MKDNVGKLLANPTWHVVRVHSFTQRIFIEYKIKGSTFGGEKKTHMTDIYGRNNNYSVT